MTLWNLPAEVEDRFEVHWQEWLDQGERWRPFYEMLAAPGRQDLLAGLSMGSRRFQSGRRGQ